VDWRFVSQRDLEQGFIRRVCPDCNGSKVFHLSPTERQPCNLCKTAGYLWVTLN
jgi:ribosomal protein S27E